jgi:NAD-dependent dihydropyrimidine dehydrogenase PreA subunit
MKKENSNNLSRNKIKWFPTIDYKKCIGCLACLEKCPNKVYIEKDGKPLVANPSNCTIGGTCCEDVCPVKAISHPPKSYLNNLVKDNSCSCSCGGKCGCK